MSDDQTDHHHQATPLPTLIIGSMGVVFGDIGTSPLYAVKESLGGSHITEPPNFTSVLGVISLIFWSLIIVISLKYVLFIMRADNKGEGGIMALVALSLRVIGDNPFMKSSVLVLGICGVALFLGDGVITPAISVLSAVEGLEIATPLFKPYIVPITLIVLYGLFFFQRKGTEGVGALFGPIMLIWFATIGTLGSIAILKHPEIIAAVNPLYGIHYLFSQSVHQSFLVMGAVFLSVTGAEAFYADMGHFGKRPIQWAWLSFVFPALCLNYFGQGALILDDPEAVKNPFYLLVPSWGLYPMVGLATAATVIASQAVISGAFSAIRQAIQLGFAPRMQVVHTSTKEVGQIYVPAINWILLMAITILVIGFKSSDNLAAAYGIAVTGAMVIDTTLAFGVVLRSRWGWTSCLPLIVCFLSFDLSFFGANALKIPEGGWFPLAMGGVIFTILSTWKKGREVAEIAFRRGGMPFAEFLRQFVTATDHPPRPCEGTAIFMTTDPHNVPRPLVQNLQHNWVLHQRVIFLSVVYMDVPYMKDSERVLVERLFEKEMEQRIIPSTEADDLHFEGFYRVVIKFGFAESPDIPLALGLCAQYGLELHVEDTSFFLGRATFVPGKKPPIPMWRLKLFLGMARNAESATNYFNIPPHRVVELGARVVI